jgi:hypothetical protein
MEQRARFEEIEQAILSTATPVAGADPASFGKGLIHGPAAADLLAQQGS